MFPRKGEVLCNCKKSWECFLERKKRMQCSTVRLEMSCCHMRESFGESARRVSCTCSAREVCFFCFLLHHLDVFSHSPADILCAQTFNTGHDLEDDGANVETLKPLRLTRRKIDFYIQVEDSSCSGEMRLIIFAHIFEGESYETQVIMQSRVFFMS